MLYTSKPKYQNIFKMLNHDKVEDDTIKNLNTAFRAYLVSELMGEGYQLCPTLFTREISTEDRVAILVNSGKGQCVLFDSGDTKKENWDKNITLKKVADPSEISKAKDGKEYYDLATVGETIKEMLR